MKDENDFSWIKNDSTQLKWLINYLSKKIPLSSFVEPFTENTVKQIENDIRAVKSGEGLELFIKKIRSAWTQYQRRNKIKATHVTSTLEIKKNVHKRVVSIAKKYDIPLNLAFEELLINSCDFEEISSQKEKQAKRNAINKKTIKERRKIQLQSLNLIKDKKDISKNILITRLTEEMLERHCLELNLIELSNSKNNSKMEEMINKEKERYALECQKYDLETL